MEETDAVGVDIDEIVSGFLYLGDFWSSKKEKALRTRKIQIVINITDESGVKFDGIDYYQFEMQDFCTEKLPIEECLEIIEKARKSEPPKPVYSHCHAGISRSASIVIAYIMKSKKMTYSEANEFVLRKRYVIDPNMGFVKQLQAYEVKLKEKE